MFSSCQYLYKLRIIYILVFTFCFFSVFVDEGFSIAPFAILLISLTFFFEPYSSNIDNDDILLIVFFIVYFFVGILDTTIHAQDISNMDLFSRYFLGAILVIYLSKYKLNISVLWLGYALAAFAVGFYAIYSKLYLGVGRVGVERLNPMYFGNFSMMLSVFCFAGFFWAYGTSERKFFIPIMICSGLLALVASLLSGTRGGWIGIPMLLVTFYMFFSEYVKKKYVKITLGGFSGLLLVLISIPQSGVLSRINEAVSDIKQYVNGESSTSVGYRFEMWKSGYYSFIDNPLIGPGEDQFYINQNFIVDENNLNPGILKFNHLHNQYIEELAKRGLLGFSALLLLFFGTLRLFYKRVKSSSMEIRALAAAGSLCVICIMDFCLTESKLRLTSGVMFFIFNLVFIWSFMRSQERSEKALIKNLA